MCNTILVFILRIIQASKKKRPCSVCDREYSSVHCLLDVYITVCTASHLHSISYNVITILSNRSFYNQEGMNSGDV